MRQIDVHQLADEARFNRFHGLVLFWCALIIIFDGYDLAVAGAAQWTSNLAITVSFPILLAGIGLAATYSIYMVAAFLSVFFVLKYVHETKGKELEQMEG